MEAATDKAACATCLSFDDGQSMMPVRIVFGLLVLAVLGGCARQRTLATFELKNGFICEVSEAKDYEMHVPVSVRITRGSTEFVPQTMITASLPDMDLQFELVSSSDRQVVGVIAKHEPKKILMLFDTKTLAAWPHGPDSELPPSRDLRGQLLLAALGDNSLSLSTR